MKKYLAILAVVALFAVPAMADPPVLEASVTVTLTIEPFLNLKDFPSNVDVTISNGQSKDFPIHGLAEANVPPKIVVTASGTTAGTTWEIVSADIAQYPSWPGNYTVDVMVMVRVPQGTAPTGTTPQSGTVVITLSAA